jgi:hypothetical protein
LISSSELRIFVQFATAEADAFADEPPQAKPLEVLRACEVRTSSQSRRAGEWRIYLGV